MKKLWLASSILAAMWISACNSAQKTGAADSNDSLSVDSVVVVDTTSDHVHHTDTVGTVGVGDGHTSKDSVAQDSNRFDHGSPDDARLDSIKKEKTKGKFN